MSRIKLRNQLSKYLPRIKHIEDLRSFEREIFHMFREERECRDEAKIKIFKPGDKVRFIKDGFPEKGTVQRVLNKKIEVIADNGQWKHRVYPSMMGLRKEEGATA
tara:strand:- start:18 stop:332 length:315 start_codon:yes stop_codon:yes gene_type:complete